MIGTVGSEALRSLRLGRIGLSLDRQRRHDRKERGQYADDEFLSQAVSSLGIRGSTRDRTHAVASWRIRFSEEAGRSAPYYRREKKFLNPITAPSAPIPPARMPTSRTDASFAGRAAAPASLRA